MKKINLPKISLCAFGVVFFISIIGALIEPASLFIIGFFGFFISPINILLLIIWKLFNREIKNKYYIIILIINIILFILSLYLSLHMFDNFMSLS